MGKSDSDLANVEDAQQKRLLFVLHMDDEITNSEYRQFVEWVKDSTIRVRLAILADMNGQTATDPAKGKNAGSS
jgi:hypothetical protein